MPGEWLVQTKFSPKSLSRSFIALDIYYQKHSYRVIHSVDKFKRYASVFQEINKKGRSCLQTLFYASTRGKLAGIKRMKERPSELWINYMTSLAAEPKSALTTLATALEN